MVGCNCCCVRWVDIERHGREKWASVDILTYMSDNAGADCSVSCETAHWTCFDVGTIDNAAALREGTRRKCNLVLKSAAITVVD